MIILASERYLTYIFYAEVVMGITNYVCTLESIVPQGCQWDSCHLHQQEYLMVRL